MSYVKGWVGGKTKSPALALAVQACGEHSPRATTGDRSRTMPEPTRGAAASRVIDQGKVREKRGAPIQS